ncbi:MAG: leucine-rich repeat domain-containing protein [Oscillospiraceae bacterium]|nr:leucine-rich repeat domain-containing protein [Oscillospiraceae bacterium]
MATVAEKMTAIADAIRAKTGGTDALSLDGMAAAIAGIESGGGGDELAELLTNKLTTLNSNVTSVRQYAFRGATALTTVNLPNATTIETNAFYGCTKLVSINMPKVKKIVSNAFNGCSILPHIVLPSLTTGDSYIFRYCYALKTIDLPVIQNIVANMFGDCRRLTAVVLRSQTMCTLANTSAFTNCYHFYGTVNSTYNPNGDKDGYIYVPAALVDSYKAASNWSTFASQFRALEDYTVDGTITGELDKTKI